MELFLHFVQVERGAALDTYNRWEREGIAGFVPRSLLDYEVVDGHRKGYIA
jgi:hypothetical protein